MQLPRAAYIVYVSLSDAHLAFRCRVPLVELGQLTAAGADARSPLILPQTTVVGRHICLPASHRSALLQVSAAPFLQSTFVARMAVTRVARCASDLLDLASVCLLSGSTSRVDVSLLVKETALAASFAVADVPNEYIAFAEEFEHRESYEERLRLLKTLRNKSLIMRDVDLAQKTRRVRNQNALDTALSRVRCLSLDLPPLNLNLCLSADALLLASVLEGPLTFFSLRAAPTPACRQRERLTASSKAICCRHRVQSRTI